MRRGQGWRTIRQRTAVWRMMQRAKRRGSQMQQDRAAAKRALAVLAGLGVR